MDHPAAHHFRIRDRAVHRGLGRFLSPLDRIRPRPRPGGAAHPPGRCSGRVGHDRHAGALGRGVGMAQLEVSPRRARWRHDLRPLDADPEATPDRRGVDLDRRLAGRRPHSRRRPVRRGRGGSQGPAPPGREGPRARFGAGRGCGRRGVSASKTAKTPAGRRQRTDRRASGGSRAACAGGQARKSGRSPAPTAKAATVGECGRS